MAPFLRVLAGLGPVGRRLWEARARRDLRGFSVSAEQERALAVYTDPRFLAETARWAGHLARDGATLAQRPPRLPTGLAVGEPVDRSLPRSLAGC
jgi:hypothetical protein